MNQDLLKPHREIVAALCEILGSAELPDALGVARLLSARIHQPQSYVTLAGETSTGKSTLANGLLATPLLPAYASPTTAAVTHISLRDGQPLRYHAVFRDGTRQHIDRETFLEQNARPIKDLLRLQIDCSPSRQGFDGLQVFDTPGYNSMIVEHEEVLREFLPSSDLVIFVAGYRSGFGQKDQDLLEVAQSALKNDPDIPIILVINRVPPDTDINNKRISEIFQNASDCLKRQPLLQIVESSSVGAAASRDSNRFIPPETDHLWGQVRAVIEAPERQLMVAQKLDQMLRQLLGEVDNALALRQSWLEAGKAAQKEIRKLIERIKEARQHSLGKVQEAVARLVSRIEPTMRRETEAIVSRLEKEIDDANKWLGKDDCVGWLSHHMLPHETRRAAKAVEAIIDEELQRLSNELEEIANTAVQQIENSVHIQSDAAEAFALNLGWTLAQRIGGSLVSSCLKSLGGAGGIAAGTGNLVKMIVSRTGSLFGKTFSQEVYTNIGRIFTKNAVQRLSGALQILTEALFYLHDSNTWQGKMKAKSTEAIIYWRDEVMHDLRTESLPKIEQNNAALIEDIYGDLIREHVDKMKNDREADAMELQALRSRISDLLERMKPIRI